MDFMAVPSKLMAVASTMLLLLHLANQTLDLPPHDDTACKDGNSRGLQSIAESSEECSLDLQTMTQAALHSFRLTNAFTYLDADLGYWVKPRSTAWFSCFLLQQYDDKRWVLMFQMSKPAIYSLAALLKPTIKKDTKYRLAILVLVCLACTLFKLTNGASLFICNEMFAIGKSTVSLVLRIVVQGINVALRSKIAWPTRERLLETEAGFCSLCGLPGVLGAIDGTHVTINKPRYMLGDYYYFKSGGYTLNCQAVVDSKKRFLDLFWGMPGSTNDARVLRRSTLYRKGMHNNLWESTASFQEFSPYFLGDSGYPLLPWLMVPHHNQGNLSMSNRLFNKKLCRGRCVVENVFGILKQMFRELFVKLDLQVTFLPDVILCCAILHNLLLGQSAAEMERLLHVLRTKGLTDELPEEHGGLAKCLDVIRGDYALPQRAEKRRQLAVYLALQRNIPR